MKYLFLFILLLFAFPLIAAPLEIGQDAPEIEIAKWVKNGPVKLADGKGKKVYVVEFWGTWCAPCRMSIPHLSQIQKKYKDKGLVVIGITKEKAATVEPFVKNQKDMDYNVGVDKEGKTYEVYMEGVTGIPNAFIIDRDGALAWRGHPLEMDSVLEDVINGSYNIAMQKKVSELLTTLKEQMKESKAEAAMATAQKILMIDPENDMAMGMAIFLFSQQGQTQAAVAMLDQLITFYPSKSRPYIAKLQMLNELGDEKGIESLAEIYIQQFSDNPSKLNSIAWILVNDLPFGTQPLAKALDAAQKAVKLTPESDKMLRAAHLDTLARCYYSIGRIDKAIREQEKAVSFVKGTDEESMFQKTLNFYKKTLELGKK